jgi:hypothetical protein
MKENQTGPHYVQKSIKRKIIMIDYLQEIILPEIILQEIILPGIIYLKLCSKTILTNPTGY